MLWFLFLSVDLLALLPAGTPPPSGSTAHDAITQILMSFTEEQLAQLVADIKGMAASNPTKATELFQTSPQLSYLVVQAMLALRMIDNNMVVSLVDRQDGPVDNAAGAGHQAPNQGVQQVPQQQQQIPQQQQMQQQQIQQQQIQQEPVESNPQPPEADSQQIELIRQVMQLTEDQIAALPPDHRVTLNALRDRVLRGEIHI